MTASWTKYLPILLRFAYRLTGDLDESEDLVQDTCLRALLHKSKLHSAEKVLSWLFSILANRYREIVRDRHLLKNSAIFVPIHDLRDITGAGMTMPNQEHHVLLVEVGRRISALPPKHLHAMRTEFSLSTETPALHHLYKAQASLRKEFGINQTVRRAGSSIYRLPSGRFGVKINGQYVGSADTKQKAEELLSARHGDEDLDRVAR